MRTRIGDLEQHVYSRMITVAHVWPGITPHPHGFPGSVWDLPLDVWLMYAQAADDWQKQQKERG